MRKDLHQSPKLQILNTLLADTAQGLGGCWWELLLRQASQQNRKHRTQMIWVAFQPFRVRTCKNQMCQCPVTGLSRCAPVLDKSLFCFINFSNKNGLSHSKHNYIPTISRAVWETCEWFGSLGNSDRIAGMKLSSLGSTYSATAWIKYSVASTGWVKNKNST